MAATSTLAVVPDPVPPELARSLDLAGYAWKAIGAADDLGLADTIQLSPGGPDPRSPVPLRMALINNLSRTRFLGQFFQKIVRFERGTRGAEPGD